MGTKESMSGVSATLHLFPGKLPGLGAVVLGSDLAQGASKTGPGEKGRTDWA